MTSIINKINDAKKNNYNFIDLSNESLSSIPQEILSHDRLKILFCNDNKLSKLPCNLDNLSNLQSLGLNRNFIMHLPNEMEKLLNLKTLGLNGNQLAELPDVICRLLNLECLYLNQNRIISIPKDIKNLLKLKRLLLINNKISFFPKEIGHLNQLKMLNLMSNKISSLPIEIKYLKNLEYLNLSYNNITHIPDEICELKKLKFLILDNNSIERLPRNIGKMTCLSKLMINNNPIKFPPPEIVSQGTTSILRYLQKITEEKHESKTLNEAKLLIVGQGGVGKTCLRKRLTKNTYNDNEQSTNGIKIEPFEVRSPEFNEINIKLNIWDFGGQEIYHATHQFFLTHRSVYILVWDARQEEEYGRVDYWLNTIETFAGNSPILIVLNKCDERIKELNLKRLKQRFPQIIGSYKISCKTGQGIEDLKQSIQLVSWKLPLIHTIWSYSWLNIRKKLEEETKSYILYTEYLELCKLNDNSENDARILSHYLHDLGIFLHFHEDILLQNIVILKPEWATNAVYQIIGSNIVQERNGVLYDKDLSQIWDDHESYPRDKYAELLRLMSNFELSFSIRKDRYIIAELLSSEELDYNWISENDDIKFEYHYDFLPNGIITRFIVRMHEYLIKKDEVYLCWKEGAFLKYNESIAYVKTSPSEKIISIRIKGKNARDFLSIICSDLDNIHKSIERLRVKKKVPCICRNNCPYNFDYEMLLRREKKGIFKICCEETDEFVDIPSLLDGIGTAKMRKERYKEMFNEIEKMLKIEVNPNIKVNPKMSVTAQSNSNAQTDVLNLNSFRKELPTLQDKFHELKKELNNYPELDSELNKIDDELIEINPNINSPDKVKIGTFNRIARLLRSIGDENSSYSKIVKGTEKGLDAAKKLKIAFNKIAPFIGLPHIP